MNRISFVMFDIAHMIDRFPGHADDAPEHIATDRHCDGITCIDHFHSSHHSLGRMHADASDAVFAEMLLGFDDDVVKDIAVLILRNQDGVIDRRQNAGFKFAVHDRTDDLDDPSFIHGLFRTPFRATAPRRHSRFRSARA